MNHNVFVLRWNLPELVGNAKTAEIMTFVMAARLLDSTLIQLIIDSGPCNLQLLSPNAAINVVDPAAPSVHTCETCLYLL